MEAQGLCVPLHSGDFTCLHTLLALLSPSLPVSAELACPFHTLFSQPSLSNSLPVISFRGHPVFVLSGGYSFPLSPLRFLCAPSSLPLSVSPTGALMVPLCSLYFYPSDTPLVSFSLFPPFPFFSTNSGSQLAGGGHSSGGPHQASHYRWRLLMSVGWSDPAPPARPASLPRRGLCWYIRGAVSIAA